MGKIELELVQDKYTNLIMYDGSNRCDGDDWIPLNDINLIDIVLKNTSSDLINDRIIRISETR